ncbi:MAG: hypothetical protein SRB2_02381 [Desulfobacteraceae bacterium Eth-SRB2]|nr:MAG: hypothetical protein SRB2_02381 [Desulfobacteraceae bacterium Eth-SRB2]
MQISDKRAFEKLYKSFNTKKDLFISHLMEKKWLEMIEVFLKLSPERRSAEAEKRLDETLERMAQLYNISPEEVYEKLFKNRYRMHR